MQHTIDEILKYPTFSNLINKNQIAVGGHSLGGFAALGLCGTIKKRYDYRIKAVLLFSTGAGGYLFTIDELKRVKIPSMLFLGEREKHHARSNSTMSKISGKMYQAFLPPKYFVEVKGANHISFSNRFSNTTIARLMSGTDERFKIINRYSIAFLEKHVTGVQDPENVLYRTEPLITRYLREPSPEE
ncbi:MAG: hypothetical protein K8R67_12485 [Desulfobacteraceae bacterium]|nr:hypothetical protein [Desulfobacteraceae bacterium]